LGLFITFEGIEGCGKSTQIELAKDYLVALGKSVRLLREPGSTTLGENIRKLLLTSKGDGMSKWTELFLYEACRAELVSEVISPALEGDDIILCDRFIDSTISYQGYGRGLDLDTLFILNGRVTGGVMPGLTILLDCAIEVGLKRANERMLGKSSVREDRFEREDIDFHKRVKRGFLELAKGDPDRIKVVDSGESIDAVELKIRTILDECLKSQDA
jgi:dTMP kinase